MHNTDPAQPMKRAAPSSNLQGKKKRKRKKHDIFDWTSFHLIMSLIHVKGILLLLGNKKGVKEVSCDPASIYGACRHAAEACGKK